jgi:hypothetical protein
VVFSVQSTEKTYQYHRLLAREEAAFPQGSALWRSGRSPHSSEGCALPPPGTTQPQRFATPAKRQHHQAEPRPPPLPQPGRSAAFPSHKRPRPSPKVTSSPNASSPPQETASPCVLPL